MNLQIEQGVTLICKNEDGSYNIQHTKEIDLYNVIIEIKEFLLASGFSEIIVNEYIDLHDYI